MAYYTVSGGATATHFQHGDWLGTQRMRTSYNGPSNPGTVEAKFQSLPWGDGQKTITGTDLDAAHYATLDHDTETGTDHAQFRQYASNYGRWISPDPYSGSYDMSDPQSFNRYVYAENNPVGETDSSGLDGEDDCGAEDPLAWMDYYFSAEYSGPAPTEEMIESYTLAQIYGNQIYDLPGYSDPRAQAEAEYLQYIYAANNGCSSALAAANRSAAGVARANASWSVLQTAANANGIPTALLAAIGVRETNFMNVQEYNSGPGMGVFQLTNQPGVSAAQAFNLSFSANYAADILSSNMNYLSGAFSFTPPQLLQATAASYNFGVGNISGNPNTIDVGTTDGNYGSTVVGIMSCFSHP